MKNLLTTLADNVRNEPCPVLRFFCDSMRFLVLMISGMTIYGYVFHVQNLTGSWFKPENSGLSFESAICLFALALAGMSANMKPAKRK